VSPWVCGLKHTCINNTIILSYIHEYSLGSRALLTKRVNFIHMLVIMRLLSLNFASYLRWLPPCCLTLDYRSKSWGYAYLVATHIRNRIPTLIRTGSSFSVFLWAMERTRCNMQVLCSYTQTATDQIISGHSYDWISCWFSVEGSNSDM
jgi:hypothetical protein